GHRGNRQEAQKAQKELADNSSSLFLFCAFCAFSWPIVLRSLCALCGEISLEYKVIAKSSIDKTRENSYYYPPGANGDQDDDRERITRPSSLFLCRLATIRCDRRPNRWRRWAKCARVRGRSLRDRETSEPTAGNKSAGRRLRLRVDRASRTPC